MSDMTRRQFLGNGAKAAIAAGVVASAKPGSATGADAPAGAAPAMPIVDTHQHLWDLTKLRLPWLDKETTLNRSFTTKDYLEASEGLGIVKAVYMEVAVAPDYKVAEAEYVIELCREGKGPTVAAVIGGLPGQEGFRAYIARFKDSPYVKGVRQVLFSGEPFAENPYVQDVRHLGELGLRFDLCVGPARLPDGIKLVDACPGTRFILDHCGNADPKAFMSADRLRACGESLKPGHDPDAWRRDVAALAKRKNIVCKISGIVSRAVPDRWKPEDLAPIVNHCIEVFGPDRVMLASDWPVCTRAATLGQWVGALKEIVRSREPSEQQRLFHDNAVKFYGLM